MAMKIHHNIKVLALMILIVLTATGIDWIAHQISPEYAVPSYYFRNKIIYATIWGLLGLTALRNQNNMAKKAAWISFFIAVALQTRYYLEGYDLTFIMLFMVVHFFAFLLPMTVVFKNFPELFGNPLRDIKMAAAKQNSTARFARFRKPGQ